MRKWKSGSVLILVIYHPFTDKVVGQGYSLIDEREHSIETVYTGLNGESLPEGLYNMSVNGSYPTIWNETIH